jgi:trimethylamine--corrinoid protein Co-methyltransferase
LPGIEKTMEVRGGIMSDECCARPSLRVLSDGQIEQVHEYSLRILSTTGVRVDSARARDLLARAAGTVAAAGDAVRIPRALVARALETAAREVTIYDRRGEIAFRLPGETRFGIGVTSLYYQQPETGQTVPFAREHMARMARLGGALSSFDVVSTVGVVQDVAPERSDLYGTLEMVANTVKPLVILVSAEEAFAPVLDLLEALGGDLAARPWAIPYLNPITPLVINAGTADKMFLAAERGVPMIYSNYGMAGASTPITPAGVLALLNAELLAGLVLGQLIRAGTPMILGCLPAYFDMRGMGSFYDAHSYLVDLACAEMMAHYRLPHCGTSGAGMGWGADLIAAGHQWINHVVSCAGRVGLVPFVGDNLGSKAFSPEVVVYADEVIAQARRFARGFALDDEAVDVDEIAAVGPGGNYLVSTGTLRLFRRAYYQSRIFPQLTLEDWQARGCPEAGRVLRDYTLQLLSEAAPPGDHAELMAQGEAFIASVK